MIGPCIVFSESADTGGFVHGWKERVTLRNKTVAPF